MRLHEQESELYEATAMSSTLMGTFLLFRFFINTSHLEEKINFVNFHLIFIRKFTKSHLSRLLCCIKNREQQKGAHQCDRGALKVLGQNIEFKVPLTSNNHFFYLEVCYGDLLSMGGCTKLIYTISDEQL